MRLETLAFDMDESSELDSEAGEALGAVYLVDPLVCYFVEIAQQLGLLSLAALSFTNSFLASKGRVIFNRNWPWIL